MSQNLPMFSSLRWVHILGVGGTLMGSFAAYLRRHGIRVTGSDGNIYPPMSDVLKNAGVEVFSSYGPENLKQFADRPDLVVIGNVISANNPEAQFVLNQNYVYSSLPDVLEKLILKNTFNIVVAGTHGKTTTSSLLSYVLTYCGKKPNYFIGGVSFDLPSFHIESLDAGQLFVLEGDEYDTAFWAKVPKFNYYLPRHVILTSIEYDHADIYPDLEAVVNTFDGLIKRINVSGHLIAHVDDKNIEKLLKKSNCPVFTYGINSQSEYVATSICIQEEKTKFEILNHGKSQGSVQIKLSGNHNILNSLAVWIEAEKLSLDPQKVREAFETFRGVKRRQEIKGCYNDILLIEDFAHHPTAVRLTLAALKAQYPKRRLIVVFEPRSATSRRKIFQKEYVTAFAEASHIFIAEAFDQSKISLTDRFSSQELVADLLKLNKNAYFFNSIDDGVKQVSEYCQPG
ncbi:MAG: UDP-N-acetylmuramate:L-alanyl-gamma-D-glutamyl-meso-diaminopimelate ligase, partial [Bdellovibrio sp.]|nr:UDP-N-acetylmuramate:L-alanyl-gamma-D-glutamyl-meso-diaminopimelate ligase [Bdellovibrio sp.]